MYVFFTFTLSLSFLRIIIKREELCRCQPRFNFFSLLNLLDLLVFRMLLVSRLPLVALSSQIIQQLQAIEKQFLRPNPLWSFNFYTSRPARGVVGFTDLAFQTRFSISLTCSLITLSTCRYFRFQQVLEFFIGLGIRKIPFRSWNLKFQVRI